MGQDNAELIAEAREWAFVNAVADRPEADVLHSATDIGFPATVLFTPTGKETE